MNDRFGGTLIEEKPATDKFGGIAVADSDKFGGIAIADEPQPLGESEQDHLAAEPAQSAAIPDSALPSRLRNRFALQAEADKGAGQSIEQSVMGGLGWAGENIVEPIAHPIKATERAVEGAATLLSGSPKVILPQYKPSVLLETPMATIPQPEQGTSPTSRMAQGAASAVVDFANFFLTPEGILILGIGGLPKAAQRTLVTAFGAQMASAAPQQLNAAIEAAKNGDVQEAAKQATSGIGGTLLGGLMIGHGVKPKVGGVEVTDRKLDLEPHTDIEGQPVIDIPPNVESTPKPSGVIESFDEGRQKVADVDPSLWTKLKAKGYTIADIGKMNAAELEAAVRSVQQPALEAKAAEVGPATAEAVKETPVEVGEMPKARPLSPTEKKIQDAEAALWSMSGLEPKFLDVLRYQKEKLGLTDEQYLQTLEDTRGKLNAIPTQQSEILKLGEAVKEPEPKGVSPDEKAQVQEEVLSPQVEIPEPSPATAAPVEHGPATIEEILGRPKVDRIENTLTKWIDDLESPPGLLTDPLFVQFIGRPIARLALMAAREVYRTTKSVAKAIEAGLEHLRYRNTVTGELGKFDANDARAWLRSVIPSEGESEAVSAEQKANLSEVLTKSEKAGEAGRKAGSAATKAELAPRIAALKEQLSDSVSKAQALSEHLRGQAVGAKLATEVSKQDAALIDRWLSADVENIRTSLLDLANELPVSERGRFTGRITEAMKRPPLFKTETTAGGTRVKLGNATISVPGEKIGTVEAMYQKAAKIAADIEEHIDQTAKQKTVRDIVGFRRWTQSLKIDVPFRVAIRDELARFKEALTGSMVRDSANSRPRIGLSHDELQAYQDRLQSLRDIGRSEQNVKEALWKWQKEFAEKELQSVPTNPLENRPELRPTPGDKTPITLRIQNLVRRTQDRFSNLYDKAVLPIDALFGLMDNAVENYGQLFRTWLFRHARGPLDIANGEAQLRLRKVLAPFESFVKRNKLTDENGERIAVYAHNLQEGGRERLIEMGHSAETIDRIVESITPKEKQAYRTMRGLMDHHFPELQELMRRLYNQEVTKEANYFPMPRDFDLWDSPPTDTTTPKGATSSQEDLGLYRRIQQNLNPRATTAAEKGMTITRQPAAKSPIRLDGFNVFREHMNDLLFLLEAQPKLKQLGEIARDDTFRTKYGNAGQKQFLGWLDTVTRQGRVDAIQRWKMLDTARNNLSVGMLGLKLLFTPFKHLTNWTGAYADLGNAFVRGLFESQTERGQKFVNRYFTETTMRSGGEPAQAEATRKGATIFGATVIPGNVVSKMFIIQSVLDRLGSQGAALGAYMRELKKAGIDPRSYDTAPINPEAQAYAMVIARRSIASPMAKDVPQALSRGTLTGGNVSWGRTLLQFQNIMADLYSRGRLETVEGLKTALSKKDGAAALRAGAVLTGLLAGVLLESGLIVGRKKVTRAITGQPDKDDEYWKTAMEETIRRVPGGGQVTSAFSYNEVPVPALSVIPESTKAIKQVVEGKPGSVAHAIGTLGQVAGIPSEPAELISKAQKAVAPKPKRAPKKKK